MYQPQRIVTILVGGWFGDEGKGKFISYLANEDNFKHVARAGVGTNAGHTVYKNGKKYALRMISSGFTNPNATIYIGKGVLVNPAVLLAEIEICDIADRVYVDRLAYIIEQRHIDIDTSGYNKEKVGSTGTGCGPAQLERVSRSENSRFAKDIKELEPYVEDVSSLLLDAIGKGENVLVEMTQGTMLSLYGFEIDDQLTYYNATSKDTTAGSACADIGIGPTAVKDVLVIYKAIPSRVGRGVFPGERSEEEQEKLRDAGKGEYGTVTNRPRRLGEWTPQVYELARKTAQMNGATQIGISKIDVRFEGNNGVREYDKLTSDARQFIEHLEDEFQLPVTLIGTGQDMYDIVDRR